MRSPSLLLSALLALAAPSQFENNLRVNGDARRGAEGWKAYGLATVERFLGERCFSVRYKSSFSQEVALPGQAAGGFARSWDVASRSESILTGRSPVFRLCTQPSRPQIERDSSPTGRANRCSVDSST